MKPCRVMAAGLCFKICPTITGQKEIVMNIKDAVQIQEDSKRAKEKIQEELRINLRETFNEIAKEEKPKVCRLQFKEEKKMNVIQAPFIGVSAVFTYIGKGIQTAGEYAAAGANIVGHIVAPCCYKEKKEKNEETPILTD